MEEILKNIENITNEFITEAEEFIKENKNECNIFNI